VLPHIPRLKILGFYFKGMEGKDREKAAKGEKKMRGCKGKGGNGKEKEK